MDWWDGWTALAAVELKASRLLFMSRTELIGRSGRDVTTITDDDDDEEENDDDEEVDETLMMLS